MKTFNYASTASIKENLTSIIIGIALIAFPLVHPFGIRIGATQVLGPIPTTIPVSYTHLTLPTKLEV